jgi:adenosylcobinamide-GDP ribazoletransferase
MFILSGLSEAINFLTIFKLRGLDSRLRGNDKKGKNKNSGEDLDLNLDADSYKALLKKSIKYFPLAGLLIGIMLALVFYIFGSFMPQGTAILITIFFLYIITGGLHFDGLSDTADGLFAYLKSGDKNKFYKAMKDSNTGAAGNTAVIFYVLIMWSLIASSVSPVGIAGCNIASNINGFLGFKLNLAYLLLLVFPSAGRYAIVLMSYFSDTPDNFKGIGTIFTEGTNTTTFIAASVFITAIAYGFFKLAGVFSLLITIFIVLLAAFYFRKRFGGVNGDMIGFGVKLSEVVFVSALIEFHRILY